MGRRKGRDTFQVHLWRTEGKKLRRVANRSGLSIAAVAVTILEKCLRGAVAGVLNEEGIVVQTRGANRFVVAWRWEITEAGLRPAGPFMELDDREGTRLGCVEEGVVHLFRGAKTDSDVNVKEYLDQEAEALRVRREAMRDAELQERLKGIAPDLRKRYERRSEASRLAWSRRREQRNNEVEAYGPSQRTAGVVNAGEDLRPLPPCSEDQVRRVGQDATSESSGAWPGVGRSGLAASSSVTPGVDVAQTTSRGTGQRPTTDAKRRQRSSPRHAA